MLYLSPGYPRTTYNYTATENKGIPMSLLLLTIKTGNRLYTFKHNVFSIDNI